MSSSPASERRRPATGLVIAVLSICGTVVSLQQTLVVPLLPDFPAILHTTADNASWLVTVTLLVSAVATPIVSRLADMFGKRRMMLVALGSVVIGSLIPALLASLPAVLVGRGLQGVGASLIPVGISIMRDELPGEKVGGAVALMSATLGIGGAIGMPLAGVIYEHLSWHALFWVSVVFGVVMFVVVLAVVPESQVRTGGRFDVGGAVLLSVALAALMLGISKGGTWGWTSEATLGCFLLAVVVAAIWAPTQLRAGQPLVDLRTSARRPVLLTNIASILLGFAMFGNMLSTTQQMQMPKATGYGFGLSVTAAGLCMLPGGLSMVVFSPISAAITRRFGARTTLVVGALIMVVGYVGRVFMTDSILQVIIGASVISIGTAVGYAAMPTLIMRAVPITETASANGLNTLLRAVGTTTSSAALAALLSATTMQLGSVAVPTLDAFRHSFWLAAVAALAAAGVALALPRTMAAAPAVGAAAEHDRLPAGDHAEHVVTGRVVDAEGAALARAVVTAILPDGTHVDWGRTDEEGTYRLAIGEPGRHVLVVSADGYASRSLFWDVQGGTIPALDMLDRLSVRGTVRRDGEPVPDAPVALVKQSGEFHDSVTTDAEGTFCTDLPPSGRYVLTAIDPVHECSVSRAVVVGSASAVVDLDLTGTRDQAVVAGASSQALND
ncbi:MFS transporter [Luteipulveratus sp. YIM 133132]|uniref:MFS transporter n=1 Tax=Luteipulveratus flavus TaxID=3031728 RepID=UPI0023AF4568|nr:MFS transporter [Luteipulveratus sp. YIM 133132]MDE9367432.1 MFS transporter [Luteipulveratus sp. YIM 133132]